MTRIKSVLVFTLCFALLPLLSGTGPGSEVNVWIGTGGTGFGVGSTTPAAAAPFGLVRLGPDTRMGKIESFFGYGGGYWYPEKILRGFSHTHLSGIGVSDYGNLRFMPAVGRGKDRLDERKYRTGFRHQDETAHPGYYSVLLGNGIKAELTATLDSGFHRYTYPQGQNALLILDLSRALLDNQSCGGEIKIDPAAKTVSGLQIACGSFTKRNPGGIKFYYFARISEPFESYGIRSSEFGIREKATEAKDKKTIAYFDFGPINRPVLLKVGISLISVEQARKNLDAQIPEWDFNKTLADAEKAWKEPLSKIEITGGSRDQRAAFYSALYHSYFQPTNLTEQGGAYLGLDGKTHQADWGIYYSDFSIWDTYRTLHPLLVLLEPKASTDMMETLAKMAEQGGFLPRWPTANMYTNCMTGTFGDCVLADGYLKGLTGFEAAKVYENMVKIANEPTPKGHPYTGRPGILDYKKYGYLPKESKQMASSTLEYAYCDFCIAQMATKLGRPQAAQEFFKRSKYYKNQWDPASGFFRPRKADGKFAAFSPTVWGVDYTEGTAWQWLWTNWYDPQGMADLFGGREKMVARLEKFMELGALTKSNALPNTYFWPGNEPDMQAPYLFNQLGRPDLTQKWVRWVIDEKFPNTPAGIPGNDDCGTMSAFLIFSELGFYPIAGTDLYYLTAPLFPEATMHLEKGDLKIQARGAPEKIYIKSVKLNGKNLDRVWIRHKEITGGGATGMSRPTAVLEFELSEKPTDWGKNSPEPEFRIR